MLCHTIDSGLGRAVLSVATNAKFQTAKAAGGIPHKRLKMKIPTSLLIGLLATNLSAVAQNAPAPATVTDTPPAAVTVGKGSYAASIPATVSLDKRTGANKAQTFDDLPVNILTPDDRPVPSHRWYGSVLYENFGVGLWPYPLHIETSEQGFQVFFPTVWGESGSEVQSQDPILISGKDFKPTGTKAKDWSDWSMSFRLGESSDKYIDATMGEGMPYLWLEYHGVSPTITLPAKADAAQFFDAKGAAMTLPVTGDTMGITYSGRNYAIFAPDGTKFEADADGVAVTFAGTSQFLVLCPLPAAKDIDTFHKYAFAVPRETTLSWNYDAEKGVISTNWKIRTEPLKGTETAIIQGWLPHHYRNNLGKLDFNGLDYITGRGTMHCAVGNDFTLSYAYSGIVPNLPAPTDTTGDHPFDPAKLQGRLADIAANPKFAGDTYWGGKDLVRFEQAALIASQTKDPSHDAIAKAVHDELVNWYTYTSGKPDHLFAYYPKKKGLVGFNASFGSEEFTDNHFHYGYFTYASALAAMQDPSFVADYGPMATLVAKQYANWDHADKRFPFLRTFDVWQGHSWASSTGSKNGTLNQESSSEATQSWAGLILLGQALSDKDMLAAGIMGYTFESQATLEYWFNEKGDVFPPEWKHPIAGMIWSSGKVWGTWFSGDPKWIYGIQWVPTSPSLSYFVHDPAWARKNYETMFAEFAANEEKDAAKKPGYVKKPADITSTDGDLASYLLGYVMMYDPQWVVEQLDTLDANPDDKVTHKNPWIANIYYQAHTLKTIGHVDWSCHGNSATSMVYVNDATKTRTYVAWNPSTTPQTVQFYEGDKPLGQMIAAPQAVTGTASLTSATK